MNRFNKHKHHQIGKIWQQLSILSLPVLSIPLLLSLVAVESSPPAPRTATSLATSTGVNQIDANGVVVVPEPQLQPVNHRLATTKPSAAKASSPKPQPKQEKHVAVKKTPTPKVKAEPKYTAPAIKIRVAIALNATNIAIGSSTEAQIIDAEGGLIQQLPAGQSFEAQPIDAALTLGDWQFPSVVWVEPTKGGAVYVGDRAYRGRLLLVSQGSTLLAVNYVDLEQYLASVVGSEMNANEPLEALKAQAIAARSYAIVHLFRPANNLYDLGATQRWQVYKGLDTEYNTTQAAVSQTAGQILSYQGGVVESTYAATDEIVAKAHGGRGMSQEGAADLAVQGYEYQQILAVYYPGAEVARLEMEQ